MPDRPVQIDLSRGGYLGRRVIPAWDDGPDPITGKIVGVTAHGWIMVVWDDAPDPRPVAFFTSELRWAPPEDS